MIFIIFFLSLKHNDMRLMGHRTFDPMFFKGLFYFFNVSGIGLRESTQAVWPVQRSIFASPKAMIGH